ncbi:hypothetical protein ACGFLS_01420 [Streptomyces abikoensis]|uniref:hypothetical protein n=1 Tax=Streptomyces abikoensis TaxID=97398 RepID=UPI003720BABF
MAAWSGPKGFASVIYGLLVLQAGTPQGNQAYTLIAVSIRLVSDDAAAERLRKYRVDLIVSYYAPPSTAGPRCGCSPTG